MELFKGGTKVTMILYEVLRLYTFILIFKFTFIYLLYVLFVLKVEGNFGKKKSQLKRAKTYYFLYM